MVLRSGLSFVTWSIFTCHDQSILLCAGIMLQIQYEYEEVVPSVAGGDFGLATSGPNTSAPYEMVRDPRTVPLHRQTARTLKGQHR